MANTKISALSSGAPALATDALPIARAGANWRLAVSDILTQGAIATYSPTVTLVGGAGNTVPQYTTNTGQYTQVRNLCGLFIYLDGDGGNEGAGTGVLTIALPIAANSSAPLGSNGYIPCGMGFNGANNYLLVANIIASGTTLKLNYMNTISTQTDFTGNLQNNTSRTISVQIWYPV